MITFLHVSCAFATSEPVLHCSIFSQNTLITMWFLEVWHFSNNLPASKFTTLFTYLLDFYHDLKKRLWSTEDKGNILGMWCCWLFLLSFMRKTSLKIRWLISKLWATYNFHEWNDNFDEWNGNSPIVYNESKLKKG